MAMTARAPAPPPGPVTRLLNVKEAADRLRVSKDTLYRLIYRGQLFAIKSGGRRLVPEAALEDYIRRLIAEASDGGASDDE